MILKYLKSYHFQNGYGYTYTLDHVLFETIQFREILFYLSSFQNYV